NIAEIIRQTVDPIARCAPEPITSPGTITTSGCYCLGNDIAGQLVIDVDNVCLDLNGYCVADNETSIVVNGHNNITIKNGCVTSLLEEGSCTGILMQDGSQTLIIDVQFRNNNNVTFTGILILGYQCCTVCDCHFWDNQYGICLENSASNTAQLNVVKDNVFIVPFQNLAIKNNGECNSFFGNWACGIGSGFVTDLYFNVPNVRYENDPPLYRFYNIQCLCALDSLLPCPYMPV
ncbi:MAG: right-handed parallel beta-helix repeat-containing protein, partial [Candidatus Babeliales bacterium]